MRVVERSVPAAEQKCVRMDVQQLVQRISTLIAQLSVARSRNEEDAGRMRHLEDSVRRAEEASAQLAVVRAQEEAEASRLPPAVPHHMKSRIAHAIRSLEADFGDDATRSEPVPAPSELRKSSGGGEAGRLVGLMDALRLGADARVRRALDQVEDVHSALLRVRRGRGSASGGVGVTRWRERRCTWSGCE